MVIVRGNWWLYLVASLTLGHPFSANLDPGLAEDLDHLEGVDHEGTCCLAREGVGSDELALSLVVSALGLELNPSAGHHTSSQPEYYVSSIT